MEHGTVCGKPTNESVGFGTTIFYFCHEHLKAGAEQITGRKFKDSPIPRASQNPKTNLRTNLRRKARFEA